MSFTGVVRRCRVSASAQVILAVSAVVLLISLAGGSLFFSVREEIGCGLPRFSAPVFIVSLLILLSHLCISLMLCFTMFDNYRCTVNRLFGVCTLAVFVLSVIYTNMMFHLGAAFIALLVCAAIIFLLIYLLIKLRGGILLALLNAVCIAIYVYLFIITFCTVF